MNERWAEADSYEGFIGRWSRPVAERFLAWLDPAPGLAWIDVGSGTGALGHAVLAQCAPAFLLAADRSHAYLAAARRRAKGARGGFVVADARELPAAPGSLDVAVSGLVLNFVPEPAHMVAEMANAVRPGGSVALYVWDYAGRMEALRTFWDAAVELDPSAAELDEGRRFPICGREPLYELFVRSGLREVEVRSVDVATRFRDFDDFWNPFLGGQGPAPGYAARLDETERARLRERIRDGLPHAGDGSIPLTARAWAVKGRKE